MKKFIIMLMTVFLITGMLPINSFATSYNGTVRFETASPRNITFSAGSDLLGNPPERGESWNKDSFLDKLYFVGWSTSSNYPNDPNAKLFYPHEPVSAMFPSGLSGGEKIYPVFMSMLSISSYVTPGNVKIGLNDGKTAQETVPDADVKDSGNFSTDKTVNIYYDQDKATYRLSLDSNFQMHKMLAHWLYTGNGHTIMTNSQSGLDSSAVASNSSPAQYTFIDLNVIIPNSVEVPDELTLSFSSYTFQPHMMIDAQNRNKLEIVGADPSEPWKINFLVSNTDPNTTFTVKNPDKSRALTLRTILRTNWYGGKRISNLSAETIESSRMTFSSDIDLKVLETNAWNLVTGNQAIIINGVVNGYIKLPTFSIFELSRAVGNFRARTPVTLKFLFNTVNFNKNLASTGDTSEQNLGSVYVVHNKSIISDKIDNGKKPVYDPNPTLNVIGDTLPDNPQNYSDADGDVYTFTGWNTEADGSGTAFDGNTPVTEDKTVYAQWQKPQKTLTYNSNGASGTVPASVTKNKGESVTISDSAGLSLSGKVFRGWNTQQDGNGTNHISGSNLVLITNQTLYAIWGDPDPTYNVSYNANGGTGTINDPNAYLYNAVVTTADATALTPPSGMKFAHWSSDPGGSGTIIPAGSTFNIHSNTTLYAIWIPIASTQQYPINYYGNGNTGGTSPASTTVNANDSVAIESFGTLTKTGHTFEKWAVNPNGTGATYQPGDMVTVTAPLNLYAIWTPNQHTISYDGNTNDSGTAPTSETGAYGSTVSIKSPGALAKANHIFIGWNTSADGSGDSYLLGSSIVLTGDLTLYAIWQPDSVVNPTLNVTYNANGGTGNVPADVSGILFGHVVTLENADLTVPGKSFSGWNTKPDGTGAFYPANTNVTMTGNLDLYAVYTPNDYRVYYDRQEGNGIAPFDNNFYRYDDNVTVKGSNGLTKTGYTFEGWSTAPNGGGTRYAVGTTFQIKDNTTLYAVWQTMPSSPPSGSSSAGGGGGVSRSNVRPPSQSTQESPAQEKPTATNQKIIPVQSDKLNSVDHYAYMFGYPDGTFRPDRIITRAEVTVMFARLLTEKPPTTENYSVNFTDVKNDAWFYKNLAYMNKLGIVGGYPDGTFKPNKAVTRAEFSAISGRFDKLIDGKTNFDDVSRNHWAIDYINSAVERGWAKGYENNTFAPERGITRAEVITITNRMLNRHADKPFINVNPNELIKYSDLNKNFWAYYEVVEATNGHGYSRDKDGMIENTWKLNGKSFK